MLMAPGPAMLGSYRKLVHICDTIKRKTYLFNLWKQEKKLSKILTRQLNNKQGLGGKIIFSFLWLVKFEDSKQNGD